MILILDTKTDPLVVQDLHVTDTSKFPSLKYRNLDNSTTNSSTKTDKYAVIIINSHDENKLAQVNREFKKLEPCNSTFECRRSGTAVSFASERDLTQYKSILEHHNIKYRNDNKTLKYVLKGPVFPPLEIQSELVDSGFQVIELTNMVSWTTKRPLSMFRITLDSEPNSPRIEEVNRVGLHKVIIEPFKRNRKTPTALTA